MAELTIYSPIGPPTKAKLDARRSLESLEGKRVAFCWGMHDLSTKFWPVFESEMIEKFNPSEIVRHHKTDEGDGIFKGNTWIAAPEEQMVEIAGQVDYGICGVGA